MTEGQNSIADDILRNGFERWQRLEGEKQAISDDLRELFAELKGQGFDSKALRASFRMVAKAGDVAVEEHNALVDLYVDSLLAPAKSETGTVRATHTRAAREADAEDREDALAALRADPDMAIVDAKTLTKKPEQQAAPQPASGLTSPLSPKGQVAPIQPETANEDEVLAAEGLRPGDEASASNGGSQDPCVAGLDMDAAAPSPGDAQPKYAPPGEIVWETHPPEGVERGAISMAFGSMGQDIEVIKDDLAKAAAQPIVKKGNVILDGWARYMAARNMVELDGSPMAYPVVQYDGTDVLTDIIKLNVEGRMLTEQQKRLIAANLARQEPSRKEDIYRAFEVFLEPV